MDFAGKTLWITGASSGIGKAVAIELSSNNAKLILSGRNEQALQATEEICKQNGCTTIILPFDLGEEASIKKAAAYIRNNKIKIDALYQFGGISQRSFVAETPLAVDRKIFEVNYFGTIALTKHILPAMIENGGGQIAVTSSIVGKFGFPVPVIVFSIETSLTWFFREFTCREYKK